MKGIPKAARLLGVVALVIAVAIPAAGLAGRSSGGAPAVLGHLSQVVQSRYYLAHPEQAPESLRSSFGAANQATSRNSVAASAPVGTSGLTADVFNNDTVGLPQNEESVTVCKNDPNVVVGGANDYRGLLDSQGNFTGWYYSRDGGSSVAKEGLLPPVLVGGQVTPSGGDPVTQSDDDCNIYAGSLVYNAVDPFGNPSGIAVYRTDPRVLDRCKGGQNPDQLTTPGCWPKRRLVAHINAPHFLDKEWMDVGRSGEAGNVIWVVYSDFTNDPNAPVGFSGAQIKAVRCNATLSDCTSPILISGADQDVQFGDVTIAQDGKTMITWAQINGELEQTAQSFTIKMRVAPAGSTHFGPTQIVNKETNPLPFSGFLHANDFRTATYPKSIMPMVNGQDRAYVAWDRCRYRLMDNICEEPVIRLSHSDDGGRTWSTPVDVSGPGDAYFPAISDEVGDPNFALAYYTNRRDAVFHNRQDVEMVTINSSSGQIVNRQTVTRLPNETEADPILGGFFIGDYFDVHLLNGEAYVAYNANYRHVRVLGQGFSIPQQDNYLTRIGS